MAVILAGYEPEMLALFRNCQNPGLARRFNLSEALRFEDFNDDELKQILLRSVQNAGLVLYPEDAVKAVKVIARGRKMDNFGNAGAVDSALTRAKTNKSARLRDALTAASLARRNGQEPPPAPHPDKLIYEDFITEETSPAKARAAIASMVNVEHITRIIDQLEATLAEATREGKTAADLVANNVSRPQHFPALSLMHFI
jgi:AAA lid domain